MQTRAEASAVVDKSKAWKRLQTGVNTGEVSALDATADWLADNVDAVNDNTISELTAEAGESSPSGSRSSSKSRQLGHHKLQSKDLVEKVQVFSSLDLHTP